MIKPLLQDLLVQQKVKFVGDESNSDWVITGIDDEDIIIRSNVTNEFTLTTVDELRIPAPQTEYSPPYRPNTPTEDSPPYRPNTPTEDSPPFRPNTPTEYSPPYRPNTPTEVSPPYRPNTPTEELKEIEILLPTEETKIGEGEDKPGDGEERKQIKL